VTFALSDVASLSLLPPPQAATPMIATIRTAAALRNAGALLVWMVVTFDSSFSGMTF
jgi:hypothetical protein